MRNMIVTGFIAAPLLAFAMAMPSFAADPAPTTCKDGTTTTSTGKGTCSGHGGVQKAAKAAPAAPAAAAPAAAPAAPAAGATTTCADGTTSTSSGKGTCSGHGGVQKAAKAKPATAAATATPAAAAPATKSAPTTAASNTDPTGATAKCKDGTYSKSTHHSGTCSSHGGVAEWLTAAK
jgi:hypothetical protein